MPAETLFIDDDDRYSRLRLIAWWDQEKLARAKVLVVGAGALGNEVLKNLALVGVGFIYVIDFDTIEKSNLTRSILFRPRDCGRAKAEAAAESLRDLNPDTKIKPMLANVITDVGLGLFREVDVVIGCLDNREARLWVNRQCWKVNTPWIDGGIQEINGVCKVFQPPDSACYECAMTENDYKLINLRYSCPLLKQEDLQAGKVPTAPTISSMIGGLQTQEALKLIHGMPVASGEAMVYNGVANRFYHTKFQRNENCLSHDTYPKPISLPLASTATSAKELFAAAKKHMNGTRPLTLGLDRDLIISLDCNACGESNKVMRPRESVSMKEAQCSSCNGATSVNATHVIEEGSELAEQPLERLGVPLWDIVRVSDAHEEILISLDGDQQAVTQFDA